MNSRLIPRKDDLFFPIEQYFNKFFDEFFNTPSSSIKSNASFPKLNVFEADDELHFTFAVSGMAEKDVKIEITPENLLVISGHMSEEFRMPPNSKTYFNEVRSSSFERKIELPDCIEGDPKAVLKDGMLKLSWKLKGKPVPLVTQNKRISISNE